MTKSNGIRIGMVTAVAVIAAVGILTLTPNSARAAEVVLTGVKKAFKQVTTAKVAVSWRNEDGTTSSKVIWSDDHRARHEQASGVIYVCKDGKFGTYGHVPPGEEGMYIRARDPQEEFSVEQTFRNFSGHAQPEDMGTVEWNGQTYRRLGAELDLDTDGLPSRRCEYWVDEHNNLPVRYIEYRPIGGEWTKIQELVYEFNVELQDSLFDLPEGAVWKTLPPPTDEASVVGERYCAAASATNILLTTEALGQSPPPRNTNLNA